MEMTSVVSADVCDWLQLSQPKSDGVTPTRKYDLLLSRSAGRHRLQRLAEMKVRTWSDSQTVILAVCMMHVSKSCNPPRLP